MRQSLLGRRVLWIAVLWASFAMAQPPGSAQAPTRPAEGMIRLTFPEDMEIKVLAEYVSQRLGVNILYDEKVGNKRVTIKTPVEIPKQSLLGLLQSALQMKGLVLVDGEQPGWKKIVAGQNLATVTRKILDGRDQLPPGKPMEAVTQVVRLQHVAPEQVERVLKPFLTQPGANTFSVPEQSCLIVTDYGHNFPRLAELIRLTDRPGPEVAVKFFPARHVEASRLAADVTRLLSEKRRQAGRGKKADESMPTIFALERTNQLVSIGTEEQAKEVAGLMRSLDVPLEMVTKVYQFGAASPERVEKLAKELIDPGILKHRYRSSVDGEMGLLIVTAPLSVHEKLSGLKKDLDVIAEREASPIRFYKLLNTSAAEVLATIKSLQGGKEALAAVALPERAKPAGEGLSAPVPGPNLPPPPVGGGQLPRPPAYRESGKDEKAAGERQPAPLLQAVQTGEATVTADGNTNTIIVVGPPAIQRVYDQLIKILDKRRPQVLVEVLLVTLDTSGGFSLGVELLHGGSGERHRYLTFSSFGLSTVDTATGSLALKPGVGFNGALVSPDTVDVVIKALQTSGRAEVISTPRILVNDNAAGTLASIAEAPFSSVNAFDTVATTSFAGYASAGTTITVTPHISEGDHLQLNYSVTLSSFTGEGANGFPPPRQTNKLSSEVTIPNGHAIIVGGLNRHDRSKTVSRVPILGEIPLLGLLFSDRSRNESENTLFVFIRPIILRDDNFEDLKYLSDRDLTKAGLPGNYPGSDPLMMD